MTTIHLHPPGIVCALGSGIDAVRARLLHGDGGGALTVTDRYSPGRPLPLGEVHGNLPTLDHAAPGHRIRNNALALATPLAFAQQAAPVKAQVAGNAAAAEAAALAHAQTAGRMTEERLRATDVAA